MQLEALIHPFFDELRDPNTRLPNGRFLPPLFNFKPHGNEVVLEWNLLLISFFLLFIAYLVLNGIAACFFIRTEGRACGYAGEADPWASKKAVCLPWFVIWFYEVEACSLQVAAWHKYLICCRDVASDLYQVKIWKSCAIYFVTP